MSKQATPPADFAARAILIQRTVNNVCLLNGEKTATYAQVAAELGTDEATFRAEWATTFTRSRIPSIDHEAGTIGEWSMEPRPRRTRRGR